MEHLSQAYWEKRWQNNETGWDIGYVSPPIKTYFDQINDYEKKILIPGAGNAYEAQYLFELGFQNTFIVDLSESAIKSFLTRVPGFPNEQAIHANFFDMQEDGFDIVVEQTFFCALDPRLRDGYVNRMHQLLKNDGRIIGVMFDWPEKVDGPPFGGSIDEYQKRFQDKFEIEVLEACYNSIPPRSGKELFVSFKKV